MIYVIMNNFFLKREKSEIKGVISRIILGEISYSFKKTTSENILSECDRIGTPEY